MKVYALVKYDRGYGPILIDLYENRIIAEEHQRYYVNRLSNDSIEFKVEFWKVK